MSNFVVLNNQEHRHINIITDRSLEYGDGVMHAMTFPMEFRDIQSCYPIFFCKDPDSGQFYPAALFGLEKGENLFLTDSGWDASYIPMMVRRHPFLIGFQNDESYPEGKKPVVSIDLDHPRVSNVGGEILFSENGGSSDYLKQSMVLLESIHQGHEQNKVLIEMLLEHSLLEEFAVEVTLRDGSLKRLSGFYTIAEENLYALSGDVLGALNEKGFLQAIFMAVASLSRLRPLVEKKTVIIS
ncbi:MAG TPA: multidrug transporter [Porticoccaceae bacterium]|jgi:hypothetical protein|nr:multidrug transporter [Porticoccaceae bacterium]